MELFNKLEDVISFILTSHGKKQFALGNFTPTYYAFSDSDILYDTKYSPITERTEPSNESQNASVENINEKDRPKPFTFPDIDNEYINPNYCILGSSELGNNLYPAFEIKIHNGKISGSSYITGTFLNQNIPTININLNCKYNIDTHLFEKHEELLLEINELNGLFEKENFEYSVFRRFSPTTQIDNSLIHIRSKDIPLDFIKNSENVTKDKVEYWLDIEVDDKVYDYIDFSNNADNIYLRSENTEKLPEIC